MPNKTPAIMQMCRRTGRTTRMLTDWLRYTKKNNTDDGIILAANERDCDRLRAVLSKITDSKTALGARIIPLDDVIIHCLRHSDSTEVSTKAARSIFGVPKVQLFIDHAALEAQLGWVLRTYHHWDESLRLDIGE